MMDFEVRSQAAQFIISWRSESSFVVCTRVKTCYQIEDNSCNMTEYCYCEAWSTETLRMTTHLDLSEIEKIWRQLVDRVDWDCWGCSSRSRSEIIDIGLFLSICF